MHKMYVKTPIPFSSKLFGDSFLALPMDMKITKNFSEHSGFLNFFRKLFLFSETVRTVICPFLITAYSARQEIRVINTCIRGF